jgi:hypothetical protein
MKVGDLVTVLPAGESMYLVVEYLQPADTRSDREELGPLWALYNEELGIGKMHEKWMEIISEVGS